MDEMGDRMKAYERATAQRLDPCLPILARVDGRAFSAFTRGCQKPFDPRVSGASPRDREVQAIVLELVAAYAFREAAAILNARLREIAETQRTHIETVFLTWRDLPEDERPDFLTYAHHRRRHEIDYA